MIKEIIYVGIGGGIGSIFRYLTSFYSQKILPGDYPWGTFVVNMIGCLLIGILLGLIEKERVIFPQMKQLLIVGFCGGFTTFSSFAAENIRLIQSGQVMPVMLYTAASVLLGLAAVGLGLYLVK